MRRLLLFFLLLPLIAKAEWDQLFCEDEDPNLFHHVNVITGNLCLCMQDTVVQGAKTLPLIRTYTSAGALERAADNADVLLRAVRGGYLLQGGWNFLPHTNLLIESAYEKKEFKAHLPERSGNVITYSVYKKEGKHTLFLKPDKTFSQCSGTLTGRTNYQKNILKIDLESGKATLYLPDGGRRKYSGKTLRHYNPKSLHKDYYVLDKEILPSKHRILYEYNDNQHLNNIFFTNPSETKHYSHISFLPGVQPFSLRAYTSDGKQLYYKTYKTGKREYLSEVESSCRPDETIYYNEEEREGIGARMSSFKLGGKKQIHVNYVVPSGKKEEKRWRDKPRKQPFDADKVQSLEAPIGPQGEMVEIARFEYYEGEGAEYTDAYDVEGCLTRYYHHDGERLCSVDYFDNKKQLRSSLKYIWKDKRLLCKVFCNAQRKPLFAKKFTYDDAGNVTKEVLFGSLTGENEGPFSLDEEGNLKKADKYQKKYTYLPELNLPVKEEEEDGLTYRYSYKQGTDLITAKHTCDKDRILLREFFFYNEDHLLVAEIIDDGTAKGSEDLTSVTERRIKRYDVDPPSGLVASVAETYLDLNTRSEVLIKKTYYGYSSRKIVQEAICDANGTYRYTLHTQYDNQDHVIYKTNPLGQESTFRYSKYGRLKESKIPGEPKKIYKYDGGGRPASCQEVDSLGHSKTTLTQYDAKGRLLTQTDEKGNTTKQKYDTFGRCLRTEFPEIKDENGNSYRPRITFTYDGQGNLASTTNPRGETTKTYYNTYRKPIRIIQSDGTEVRHLYNKNGTLAKTIYPDHTQVHYTYDLFQRTTSKKIFSANNDLLSSETWQYNTFHLLSYTDSQGLTIAYSYDGAGRKISEEASNRKKTFSYDSLGFLERTSDGETTHLQIHDEAGRVLQEWDEDESCQQNHTTYFYNSLNRKEKAIRVTSLGEAVDLFAYDGESRLIRHTDPHGFSTTIHYDDSFHNELGQQVLQKTTTDPVGNAAVETYDALNHLVRLEKKDPQGKTISSDQFFYDQAGNKARRLSIVYLADDPIKEISTIWTYDSLGRLVKEVEAGQKTTLYEYDSRGRVKQKTLPNQTTLTYAFDGIDRLLELKSSDGTIHYQYFYAQGTSPIHILDNIHNTKLARTYNPFGELIEETRALLTTKWDYDTCGRCIHFTLPNQSAISYEYAGLHLSSVQRLSPSDHLLYEHKYQSYDPNGHVAEESLIQNLGTIQTTRDLLERPISQQTPLLQISQGYGPSGLVIQTKNTLFGDKGYRYDPLNQLLQEGEQNYHFDSFGNASHHETNDCNQILSTPDYRFIYDLNGNPVQRISPTETTTYTYDALGRLTSIRSPAKHIQYTYDALSRLLSKESQGTKTFYLYDQDKEIGTLNDQLEIQDLKILGIGVQGDIGAAIAIEIGKEVYAPLHDFNGSIVALIDSRGQLIESYDIDAFGKEKKSSALNPWRFCSKRSEEGFVFFGKRFYDPSLGRWLTPDPSGYTDGPNLYVYVLNSPLNRLDLFGLFSNENFPADIRIEVPLPDLRNIPGTYNLILCKAIANGVRVDCITACSLWYKIEFTPEELNTGKVNIIDHMHEITPKDGSLVGLVTFTNGVQTNKDDFIKNCQSILNNVSEGPLFIGLHNQTQGFMGDSFRAVAEFAKVKTPIVDLHTQFFGAIIDTIHKINPNMIWLSFFHSEGGLIAFRAFEGLSNEQKERLQNNLLVFALAPAKPIPKTIGIHAINVYSERDKITGWFGKKEVKNHDYDIKFITCDVSRCTFPSFVTEHYFLGNTLQTAMEDHISNMRSNYGFYGKTR